MSLAELELPAPVASDSDMPEGWASTKIGAIYHLNPPKPAANSLPLDAPVTFVPMPSIDAESGVISVPLQRLFREVRGGFTAFAENDVLMAKITPCMENGKAAIARGLVNGLGFGSTEFHVLRSTGAALPEYVYHYIRQDSFRSQAEKEMTGSVGQRRVPSAFLREAEIPLPPLAEQRRIVAKLEHVLAAATASRERLARVPALMKRFRQSVLAAACSGRLTADWRERNPNVEPASQLLERILAERRARWEAARVGKAGQSKAKTPSPFRVKEGVRGLDQITLNQGVLGLDEEPPRLFSKQLRSDPSGYKEPAAPDTSELPELPESWAWVSCNNLCQSNRALTYGVIKLGEPCPNGISTLRSSDVRRLFIDESHVKQIAPQIEAEYQRTRLAGGEIVVTVRGTLGGVAVVPKRMAGHNVSREVAVVPIEPCFFADFFCYAIGSESSQSWLSGVAKGIAYTGINIEDLKLLPLPVPPLHEQQEIVRQVERLFQFADAIEKRTAAAAARADKLTQSILARAFRGELVPTEAELARAQGRDYEPAAALLRRIQAEREAEPKTREPRRGTKKGDLL